jgi:hypothetical protein
MELELFLIILAGSSLAGLIAGLCLWYAEYYYSKNNVG